MAKKIDLAFISNDSSRKATFKKRKTGIMKKTAELSTLCGIQACAIIHSPYESEPTIWPSLEEARQVAAKFKELPDMEQSKNMVNQESYLRQRILKASEQLKKQRNNNREHDITQVMFQCVAGNNLNNMTMSDLSDLESMIDQHLKDISHQMENLQRMSEMTVKYPNIIVGTSNVGDHHQLAHGPIGHHIHAANLEAAMHMQQQHQQPENRFMDPMTSHEGGHVHGGLGVDGILGDEMMSFVDANNIDINNAHCCFGVFINNQ